MPCPCPCHPCQQSGSSLLSAAQLRKGSKSLPSLWSAKTTSQVDEVTGVSAQQTKSKRACAHTAYISETKPYTHNSIKASVQDYNQDTAACLGNAACTPGVSSPGCGCFASGTVSATPCKSGIACLEACVWKAAVINKTYKLLSHGMKKTCI